MHGRRSHSAARATALLLAVGLLCAAPGCVQRRLTIRSTPPGALVYIDNYEIGVTPVSTDYVYYGVRNIKLVRDGYETLNVQQKISPPWYQWFPLDFVAENVVPWEIRDERALNFNLLPQQIVPTQSLLERAEGIRRGNPSAPQAGALAPAGAGLFPLGPPVPAGSPAPPGQPLLQAP